ncbi:transposase [Hafnia paralvei]|uniref:transposase n=1 Tax=Hafnia paralvei TaxID=546367 RepID=UPI000DF22643|nr:transposase [Hafnia paralvei]RDA62991.1 transposase [Hafnia paralvei]RDA63831.1 transposase [Hafnia paralvei]RDA75117.1 transposase [Hafnia paralvei]RDA75522.1 transposase [Hafnia paralvei]
MESQSWRKEPRKIYSNDFKLRMVELASRPSACVAQIARENGVNGQSHCAVAHECRGFFQQAANA